VTTDSEATLFHEFSVVSNLDQPAVKRSRLSVRRVCSGSADLPPAPPSLNRWQLGHKAAETNVSADIPLSLPFAPRYQQWQRSGNTHLLLSGMLMSLFRVTKSTGGLLAIVKARDPSSALEAYARMRGHSNARFAYASGLVFADPQKAFAIESVATTHAY